MARASTNKKRSSRSKNRSRGTRKRDAVLVFTRRNYVLLVIGLAIITVGYVMMRMENEVKGFISLNVAPLLILVGYLEIMYAIMWRPDGKGKETANRNSRSASQS